MNLRCADDAFGHVAPSTASTHHSVTPTGMVAVYSVSLVVVSSVVVVLPGRTALRLYCAAPDTGSQSKWTSAVVLALSSGASSFGALGHELITNEKTLVVTLPATPQAGMALTCQ